MLCKRRRHQGLASETTPPAQVKGKVTIYIQDTQASCHILQHNCRAGAVHLVVQVVQEADDKKVEVKVGVRVLERMHGRPQPRALHYQRLRPIATRVHACSFHQSRVWGLCLLFQDWKDGIRAQGVMLQMCYTATHDCSTLV